MFVGAAELNLVLVDPRAGDGPMASSSSTSLSSALSSMEVMLDALMQRGIGKPDDKPKEEPPPALPTRPTVRGRLPSPRRHGPGSPAPWNPRPPLAPLPPPPDEEHDEEEEERKRAINLELERRAQRAEEEAKQKDDDVRHKEEEIAGLRQQVEHYESRLAEWEAKMKAVEEELQKQIAALQISQSAAPAAAPSRTTSHRREPTLSDGVAQAEQQQQPPAPVRVEREASVTVKRQQTEQQQPPAPVRMEEASVKRHHQPAVEPLAVPVLSAKPSHADHHLASEFARETQAFEHAARAVADVKPGTMSVDELKMLRRQFHAWKKEYEARLRKTKAELKKRVHSEKSHDKASAGHGGRRRWCCWWRMIKAPKCRAPRKCCTCAIKLPSFPSCCKLPSLPSCCTCKMPSLPSCKFPSLPSCAFSCCCFRRRR